MRISVSTPGYPWHEWVAVTDTKDAHPTFREAFRFWLTLGCISFGGPAGQIAIMHTELVEKRRWISESRFIHALNYCMLLPGPEATQLATYIGWLLHRTWGGIVAGVLFVLPSAILLWGLSLLYVTFGQVPAVESVFYGLKPAVLAIVTAAGVRIGFRTLKTGAMWVVAGSAFVAIYVFNIPFPLIIAGAALVGLCGSKRWPRLFPDRDHQKEKEPRSEMETAVLDDHDQDPPHTRPSLARALKVSSVCLLLWWLPVLLVSFWFGKDHTLFHEGLFFSKAAMVTFGGAYAVLPYVGQQAVDTFSWLTPGQMLDGLGLAETTPGPLIIVLQFVGFLGGWQQPGSLTPILAATFGALITLWTTFVPCFLWIFVGAPHIEQLRGNRYLSTALSTVTAAVVGVIFNLAVWSGIHVLKPQDASLDIFAILIALVTLVGLLRWKWNLIVVVIGAGAVGLLRALVISL
jgi:chromate transporter